MMMISKVLSLLSILALERCSSFSINNGASSSSSSSSSSQQQQQQHHQQRVFVSTPSRPTTKIVSDLMTSQPHLLVLTPHTPVDEAIAALLRAGVSGAPVVERLRDAEHPERKATLRLVGFVSTFDFLPREESGTLVMLGDADNRECDSETARRILGGEVRDVMTKNPITVTTNDPMKVAAETMAKHRRVGWGRRRVPSCFFFSVLTRIYFARMDDTKETSELLTSLPFRRHTRPLSPYLSISPPFIRHAPR
jgi:CBS domain-containing protein